MHNGGPERPDPVCGDGPRRRNTDGMHTGLDLGQNWRQRAETGTRRSSPTQSESTKSPRVSSPRRRPLWQPPAQRARRPSCPAPCRSARRRRPEVSPHRTRRRPWRVLRTYSHLDREHSARAGARSPPPQLWGHATHRRHASRNSTSRGDLSTIRPSDSTIRAHVSPIAARLVAGPDCRGATSRGAQATRRQKKRSDQPFRYGARDRGGPPQR